jgi:site-specific DNA recombinase
VKAVIYTRTSQDEINDPRKSNQTQEIACREVADKNEDEIVKVYSDIGKSGDSEKLKKRKNFLKLISEIKELKIEKVYFLDLSRFARSLKDQEVFIDELLKIKVQPISISDSMEKLPRQIKGIFNEQIIDVSRQRTEVEHSTRLKERVPVSRPPIGYKIDRKTHKWHINEKEAKIIKKVFEMRKSGLETSKIASEVHLLEIQVKRMLSNKAYLGIYVYRGVEKGLFHEPIISKEVFEACQK